jgi:ribosome-binding protein aMBF1 (putative translation factor)
MQYVAQLTKEGRRTLIEFPDCLGCATFADPGDDVESVAREALEGWLETYLAGGDAPPRPASLARRAKLAGSLAVRIDPILSVRLQIRWARQDAGLSQAELAKRIRVSRQQISLLESPDANLTLSTLDNVARALGLELAISLERKRPAAAV